MIFGYNIEILRSRLDSHEDVISCVLRDYTAVVNEEEKKNLRFYSLYIELMTKADKINISHLVQDYLKSFDVDVLINFDVDNHDLKVDIKEQRRDLFVPGFKCQISSDLDPSKQIEMNEKEIVNFVSLMKVFDIEVVKYEEQEVCDSKTVFIKTKGLNEYTLPSVINEIEKGNLYQGTEALFDFATQSVIWIKKSKYDLVQKFYYSTNDLKLNI